MTSRDFCYWLQGFFELRSTGPQPAEGFPLTPDQARCIERHLALVFKHEIDPSMGPPAKQQALNHIHNPSPGSQPLIRC